ncbi:MAG: adenylosuccinate synthase [Acidobacteria bacterium]|nr:adenylosuccinate synthase [Acidobacteriota bacterium]
MNIAVIGTQWGDEGKGKIVDLLTPNVSIVARYQGGHNAGHTVRVGSDQFVLHLLPSGILRRGVRCVIGNGVVVDPVALFSEIETLGKQGVEVGDRLLISDRAHLILPYHRELEELAEKRRGDRKIGTTARGIGPAYEDKAGRRGVRVGDLANAVEGGDLASIIQENVAARNRALKVGDKDWRTVYQDICATWHRLERWVGDVSVSLMQAFESGETVLFEGAQGTMLDIDHGSYPFVSSSSATAGGICTGLGIGPRRVGTVLGIAKAYITRVGEGPLPTELHGETGEQLREAGQEYGASTGRPRRCGWYDAVAARYAVRVNGLDALAVTKLDVLDGLEEIPLCTAYRYGDSVLTEFPSRGQSLSDCQPVYERLPGWSRPTAGVRRYDDLPLEAKAYLDRLAEVTGVPIALISTGSDRADTILIRDGLIDKWQSGRPRSPES